MEDFFVYYVLGLVYAYIETISYFILTFFTHTLVIEDEDDVNKVFVCMNHPSTWATHWNIQTTKMKRPGLGLAWIPGAFVWISRAQSLTAYKYAYTVTLYKYWSVPYGISRIIEEIQLPIFNVEYDYHQVDGMNLRRTPFYESQLSLFPFQEQQYWLEEIKSHKSVYIFGSSGIGKSSFADFLAIELHKRTGKTVNVVRRFSLSVEHTSVRHILQNTSGIVIVVLDEIDKVVDYAMDAHVLARNSLCSDKSTLLGAIDAFLASENVYLICTGNSDPVTDPSDERYPFYRRMHPMGYSRKGVYTCL